MYPSINTTISNWPLKRRITDRPYGGAQAHRLPLKGKAIGLLPPKGKPWHQNAGFSRGWAICLAWNGIHCRSVAGHSLAGEHGSPLRRCEHAGSVMQLRPVHAAYPAVGAICDRPFSWKLFVNGEDGV